MSITPSATRTWIRALQYFDSKDLDRSLYAFEMMPRAPKMSFNLGVVHAALGDLISAVDCLKKATSSSSASAVEYFQLGVLLFSLEDYGLSYQNFWIAYLLMAGHTSLNYKHVGLDLTLYSCEVLFNCAMCLLHQGKYEEGIAILADAREQQQFPSQIPSSLDIFSIPPSIDEPERESPARAGYWILCQLPNGKLYRPIIYTSDHYEKNTSKPESVRTDLSLGDLSSSDETQGSLKSSFLKMLKISRKRSHRLFQ